MWWGGMDLIDVIQNRDRWWAVVSVVMNIWVPWLIIWLVGWVWCGWLVHQLVCTYWPSSYHTFPIILWTLAVTYFKHGYLSYLIPTSCSPMYQTNCNANCKDRHVRYKCDLSTNYPDGQAQAKTCQQWYSKQIMEGLVDPPVHFARDILFCIYLSVVVSFSQFPSILVINAKFLNWGTCSSENCWGRRLQ